jgi:N-dimethylarginine dimethylaminohydrolase
MNEYGKLTWVAVRAPAAAFKNESRIDAQWQPLRFHSRPDLNAAIEEHNAFTACLTAAGCQLIYLNDAEGLTLDSIYTRDALVVSPKGLILCHMGRLTRRSEPSLNSLQLAEQQDLQLPIIGEIQAPGTLEGGDLIWLDDHHLAVGLGPRTNQAGIDQLKQILGNEIEVHVVPLPPPAHPEDVFHLMSMISPVAKDLALVYRPLMPDTFLHWLADLGLDLVEVPDDEFPTMGCNVLATAPRQLLMLDGLPVTRERLNAAGCQVTVYRGDHISRKGEGGPTCLTRPLVRDD